MADLRQILHVTTDFPDPIDGHKTSVIRALVDGTSPRFDHTVFSLNRVSPSPAGFLKALAGNPMSPHAAIGAQPFAHGQCFTYAAPPKGIYHAAMLRSVGDQLAQQIADELPPDLLIGHKLTMEGIIVSQMSRRLGIPYALSLQGDTDLKILRARPDLTRQFADIFHGAKVVFPFAPWTLRALEKALGKRQGPSIMLPCPTDITQPLASQPGGSGLVSVFHLKNARRKNLPAMLAALRTLQHSMDASLSIIGGGDPADWEKCQRMIAGHRAVQLEGALDRVALRERMGQATGLVMPSRAESFGLVFIEALFNGLPIIYPKGAAVDGYFDGLPFAIRVDARSSDEIAAAMASVIENEAALKQALADWQQSEFAQRFMADRILEDFGVGIEQAIAT